MAKITLAIDEESPCPITRVQVKGKLENEELIKYLTSQNENRPLVAILDLRETDFSQFDVSRIKFAPSKLCHVIREGDRRALVFEGDDGFGIGRMMEAYFDSDSRLEIRAFREMSDALSWISETCANSKYTATAG